MKENNIITPDFGENSKNSRDKETLDAVSTVVNELGKCASCGHIVLYRGSNEAEEFRCHGAPKQVVLVPAIQKKVVLDGVPPKGNGWMLSSFYPPTDPNSKACALYSPTPAAGKMIDITKRFTFFPETITEEEAEFIEMFKAHNKENHENSGD